eukprot:TRINITY_DN13742_c0_g1_i1.p1 TRINITY_DN13742_c0_g1~~TRINITY_DN13742_c0_g1_i1.p1  ORF type:complete len:379 (+),score=-14.00 TRINITY_DN13742_c0_g1_i1:182-1318(+)
MEKKKVSVALIGSTGSVGTQTLDVIERLNCLGMDYQVTGLSAKSDKAIKEQIKKFTPKAYSFESDVFSDICENYHPDSESLLESLRPDFSVIASSGGDSLRYTMKAIEVSKRVCLANKESLVLAGSLLLNHAKKSNTRIIPVDSEHSAIFQLLECEKRENIKKIIITASGGALRDFPVERIYDARVEDVLKHPTWSMGRKITIDSATMFNKGLEIIEAHHLFDVSAKDIEVAISRTSYIHSLVEFKDGVVKMHVGKPDMRVPIAYSLTYPYRMEFMNKTDDEITSESLYLEEPDFNKFPAPRLALDILCEPASVHIAYNASNEAAVELFLKKIIPFGEIYNVVLNSVNTVEKFSPDSIRDTICLHDEIKFEVLKKYKL